MNRLQRKCAIFVVGLILPLASIQSVHADDIEIFTVGADVKPKILLIFDTSISMAWHVDDYKNRFTVLEKAMDTFITTANGVEIGLMRLNQKTGAVVFPVTDLNKLITEDHYSINRPITSNLNNAFQVLDLPATGEATPTSTHPTNINTGSHYDNGRPGVIPMNRDGYIGLRFTNITIPKESIITKAYLELFPYSSCSVCTDVSLIFHGEDIDSSAEFTPELVDGIGSRARSSETLTHTITDWNSHLSSGAGTLIEKPIVVTGLEPIIKDIVDRPGWVEGNDLSLIIQTATSTNNSQGISDVAGYRPPVLYIEYTTKEGKIRSREILAKYKLLEILAEQKMTSYTAVVPALHEAYKYFKGAPLSALGNLTLNTLRSADNQNGFYKLNERVAHPDAITDGTIEYPTNTVPLDPASTDTTSITQCNSGNLNSFLCRDTKIVGANPKYISPLSQTCNKKKTEAAIILLSDGQPTTSGRNAWVTIKMMIERLISPLTCTTRTNDAETCGLEFSKYLEQGFLVDGALTTDKEKLKLYTIGLSHQATWLAAMSRQGKTEAQRIADGDELRYFEATNSTQLVSAFQEIIASVIKETVTFSNSSASIQTTNRLAHDDKVFYALFEPSKKSSWPGNLKRYKLSSSGEIYDDSTPAKVAVVDGHFVDGAKSWWSTIADGDDIKAGGVRDVLKVDVTTASLRKIFINMDPTSFDLTQLANSTTVASKLNNDDFGVNSEVDRSHIVDWMLSNNEIADPLHSTPTEVSYDGEDSVIFFGDNQGYVHAIDSETGSELYAFMPRELLKNQKRIKNDNAAGGHIYGMDGEITVWKKSATETFLYIGMRRGGSSYYALDISNRTEPKLKWIISDSATDFVTLGQTWSKPTKVKINIGGGEKEVLIFTGGYDTDQDDHDTRTADDIGNDLFIVSADTGILLWSTKNSRDSAMKYSMPSDIKAIDIDGDKLVDQIYVGDMGGQVWRFDITASGPNAGVAYARIADLAIDSLTSENRRFYHAPDVSLIKGTNKLAVAIGSGFRAHPNDSAVTNNFYMIQQPLLVAAGATPPKREQADLYNATANAVGQGSSQDTARVALNEKSGWYVSLGDKGEKVLASSLTFDNAIWFTTYKPSIDDTGCANKKGEARLYRVNVKDATPNFKHVIPDNNDEVILDISDRCDRVSCEKSDRSMVLKNAVLPPRPALLNIGGKRLIGVGTEYFPVSNNKSTMMFWNQE